MIGENYSKLGRYEEAEESFLTSWYMIPHRLWPRFLLVQMLWHKGDKSRSAELAQILLDTDVKVESQATREIKQDLKRYAQSCATQYDKFVIPN